MQSELVKLRAMVGGDPAALSPRAARELFRRNEYRGSTTGVCPGYTQTNVAILPKSLAGHFSEFCRKNHAPLPLLYCSEPGEVSTALAAESDIRIDVPLYRVLREGSVVDEVPDLLSFDWREEEFVTFYIGCSFSFEGALMEAGLELRNITEKKVVSMYCSSIQLEPVGPFNCPMAVTMRPFSPDDLKRVVEITAEFSNTHGAPIHIGDPARIGVSLSDTIDSVPVTMGDDEVPVFWGCGVTCQAAFGIAKPKLAVTHYPGSMFISDQMGIRKPLASPPKVVRISRSSAPFFASILNEKTSQLFPKLEQILLEDPGHRGVQHLFQETDLLCATLALSHAKRVAIIIGFPCLMEFEVKEETDGLPGALAICQALQCLDKSVTLITNAGSRVLYQSCVDHIVKSGGLKHEVDVVTLEEPKKLEVGGKGNPTFDCYLAIERVGRNKNGAYITAKNKDISKLVDPIDDLFEAAQTHPLVTTIAIGDGGNELGMGKSYEALKKHNPNGELLGCVVGCDFLIAAGVSNWGGYAIAAGLYAVSTCPLHVRYRNQGINAESPPELDITEFVNTEQATSLLQYMNSVGIRDGISGTLDQSVDGIPLTFHLQKMEEIIATVCT